MRVGTTSVTGTVDEELADVLIFLCAIANRLGISIDDALRKKEALNETRNLEVTGSNPGWLSQAE
jgi:NTP pyrophosphatase (non-canonical NTP hydrolase)